MQTNGSGTLSALVFRKILEGLPEVGVDPESVLHRSHLSRELLQNDGARLDAEREHEFWACVEELAGDPAVGLRLGVWLVRASSKTLDAYIVQHSPNWRALVANADAIIGLSDDRGRVRLYEEGAMATVRTYREGGFRRAAGYIESIYAAVVTLSLERVPGFRVSAVDFRRPRPRAVEPYVDLFGVVPRFGAEHNQLRFARELLDVPLGGADPVLADYLKAHALHLLRSIPQGPPLLLRVQRVLAEGLKDGRTSMSAIARATGMSSRTLRRRLSALGTTFQQLSDDLRRDLALHRLQHDDVSIQSLATSLGFGSASAFQRAFARWTGLSVSAYRERLRRT